MQAAFDVPRLLADIGGTYARFTLEAAPGVYTHTTQLRCADHADFASAVRAYLATCPPQRLTHAAVAIANPVEGDEVRMTNYHWQFSIEAMRSELGRAWACKTGARLAAVMHARTAWWACSVQARAWVCRA
jgi:glucokinase